MTWLLRIRDWFRCAEARVTDTDIAISGGDAWVTGYRRRWFRGVVSLRMSRDDLVLLGDMIRDCTSEEARRD